MKLWLLVSLLKEKYLLDNGWHTWYNDNYWVHRDTIANSAAQDYTNYGMTLEEALTYQIFHRVFEMPNENKELYKAIFGS